MLRGENMLQNELHKDVGITLKRSGELDGKLSKVVVNNSTMQDLVVAVSRNDVGCKNHKESLYAGILLGMFIKDVSDGNLSTVGDKTFAGKGGKEDGEK